ncbi:Fur family transcriptional regulator [Thiopseudomonas alkaliphila]|uniref:Fur family transcriptional regulator n=1 Tax=Thiopseudomonas alkaliphila TaxID=1697053 RepID=UPI00069E36F3|nr:Fur family transcriptional regulator [Thiopseudomonas alkaliphila]AKX45269.1 Fur family transcriptional regulator [Thiopseudomonas alkaliphila]AKX51040.1 Fur family transcriptional regulator [Thiopseudomonas alkaliphila]AKX57398.1 Fur family transcriptional regulator [Thiopseudomonas alkaliphila]
MQLTTNQQLVLNALQRADRPLSAYALLEQLRAVGLKAPVQIYRALEQLIQHGLAHRLETLNAYVTCKYAQRCKPSFKAFAICESCGHIDEFVDNDLGQRLECWAENHDFFMGDHAIELRGACVNCMKLAQTTLI